MNDVFGSVHHAVPRLGEVGRTDEQLLESWIRERDEAALTWITAGV
ncbi:MAG: hypothetical protein JWO38_3565 [Gemmataceae bacterium]|nr:hypothetical protein [Gemmataceae bacterium]